MKRFCIVGSGPAGMYSCKYLLKRFPGAQIHVIERFPVPYGLVRFGVAPDHPEVKSCQSDFAELFASERVEFFGNVEVNRDVSVAELKQRYDAVLLAHGPADGDQTLGIANEQHVFGAREFVNWYNGFPSASGVDFAPILQRAEQVVIVGNGNVALDCARILLEDVAKLRETDVAQRALKGLEQSVVKQVSVVGRRGHPHAAYTMKELREMTKLKDVQFNVAEHELDQSAGFDYDSSRPVKRMNDLLRKQVASGGGGEAPKAFHLRFFLAPQRVVVSEQNGKVRGMVFARTQLNAEGKVQPTGEEVELPCQLVLRSVGYRTESLVGESDGMGRNGYGETELEPGLFSVGWCKRGPKGIIGTNVTDAHETVELMCKRAEEGKLLLEPTALSPLAQLLEQRGVRVVNWPAYLRISNEEKARGRACDPPRSRVKIESVEEMLQVAGTS